MASRRIDEACSRVHMVFGQAEVDEIDPIFVLTATAHDKVRWFYVTVDQASLVYIFDTCQHL